MHITAFWVLIGLEPDQFAAGVHKEGLGLAC